MRAALWWLFEHPGSFLALLALALHLKASGSYGYFRDGLYFIICGERPYWGYVDQPRSCPSSRRFATLEGGPVDT
jgi:hypothetical protein